MTRATRPYLGVGWKFPLQVNATGGIATAAYEQRIEESVYLILATAKGERPMLPEFGCGIHDLVFEPGSPTTITGIVREVRRALVQHEPRIDVLEVVIDPAEGEPNLLIVRVGYRVRDNNATANVVYPFYLRESA